MCEQHVYIFTAGVTTLLLEFYGYLIHVFCANIIYYFLYPKHFIKIYTHTKYIIWWCLCYITKICPPFKVVVDWSRVLQDRVKIGSLQKNKFEPGWVTAQHVILLLPSLIDNIYFVICIGLIQSYLWLLQLILSP